MKTRKLLCFLSLAFVMILMFASCTSKEEEILEGEWYGEVQETDEDGDVTRYKVTMTFNRARDLMTIRIGYDLLGYGRLGYLSIHGDYMADAENITMFPDEESLNFEYSDELKNNAAAWGIDMSDFRDLMIMSFREEMGFWSDIPIKSLSGNTLVTDFEGSTLTLRKQ